MTAGRRERLHRFGATTLGLLVGSAAYLLTLTHYSRDLTRTAMGIGYASNFFDLQARAFLDGNLFVPRGSLGIEGFVQRGQEYMYFPPFPALVRLPVLLTTDDFDGRLTLVSMAVAFVLMAVMTTRLVWLVRDLMYPGVPVGRIEAVGVAALLAMATGGTTLTFDASDPWVYHEVYAWAIPLVIGSMYWMLRVLVRPDPSAIAWLVVFDLATVLTRTTGGWAVCLASAGIGIWLLTGRVHPGRRAGAWVLGGALGALAVASTYNWLKFRHPYMFPLDAQVWTDVNAHRQDALEANGGSITGPQFFLSSLHAYFRPDGIRFVDYFPWVTLPAEAPRPQGDVVLDQTYRTGSITTFMPWLFAATVLAALVVLRPGVDRARRFLRAPLVAGVLVTGGVMGYGYLAHRYTSEFVPALVLGGTVGTLAFLQWLRRRSRVVVVLGLVAVVAGAVFQVGTQMLTGYTETAMTTRGPALQRYLALQETLSAPQQARLVHRLDGLPAGGATDQLVVRGDCDAVYLNTGDPSQPWVPVVHRSLVLEIELGDDFRAGTFRLARIHTEERGRIFLVTNNQGQARLVISAQEGVRAGFWFDVLPPGRVLVGIRDAPDLGYAEVSSTPGGFAGFVRSFTYDDQWVGGPVDIEVAPWTTRMERRGITVSVERGLDPPLCRQIQANHSASAR